jgi:subtilisin
MAPVNRPYDDSASPYGGTVLPLRRPAALLATLLVAALATAPPALAALAEQRTWHSTQIRADRTHDAGFHGSGVVVAVLDGWIDRSHPDFGRRTRSGADCTSGTCTTTMGKDGCGAQHGTHVAGTVTSSSYGVADRATLLPVRVLAADSSGECAGDPDAVAAGIRWAVTQGAKVLNLSLGPDVPGLATSSAIPAAVHEAAAAGVVVVFSAGNADLPVAQSYGEDALVVAATGPSGELASYSQHGQGVSVAAPGGDSPCTNTNPDPRCITSLSPGGKYAVAAGTSMAAPHVAGLAALLRGAHPTWTAAQVRDRITGTARPLAGAGAGLVDAAAALGVRAATPKATPSPSRTATIRPGATSRPAPVVTPAPRRTAAPVVTPSATPVVTVTPTPAATAAGVVAETPLLPEEEVPVPLAAVAGLLLGLVAAGVVVLPRL